jgi:hypothetical protein
MRPLALFIERHKINEKPATYFPIAEKGTRRCVACGAEDIGPRRRYCSTHCRQKLLWTLSLCKGLLQTLSTRYAAFSFTEDFVVLDVMPNWSSKISRFVYKRKSDNPPAHALKELILEAGNDWHDKRNRQISRSFASQLILEEKIENNCNPDSIKPNTNMVPRLSADHRKSLKQLNINTKSLMLGDNVKKIKKAYREMAKIYHPDKGGDGERFRQINEAHELMLQWVEDPKFQSNEGLPGCWSYNGYTNKWSPPLRQRYC